MGTGQILKQVRRERDLTDEQIAQVFGLTRARWNQYAQGQPIPIERIREWAGRSDLPDWARTLVCQLWLAMLEAQHAALGEQMQELAEMVNES